MTIRPTIGRLMRVIPACAALGAAGCGDSGTGVPTLTPAQVQGVYNVCSLKFAPTQTALPTADVLASVINTTPPPPKQAPSLTLSGQSGAYQIVYTRKSDNFLQQLNGVLGFASQTVSVELPSADASDIVRELLLPARLVLTFTDSPRRLTAVPAQYSVRRADYARAAGITEEGLQSTIAGSLTATFSTGTCP